MILQANLYIYQIIIAEVNTLKPYNKLVKTKLTYSREYFTKYLL